MPSASSASPGVGGTVSGTHSASAVSCWRSRRSRAVLLGGLVTAGIVLLVSVPSLTEQMRLSELRQDIERIERGDHNSSAGARLERLLNPVWTPLGN